MRPRQSIPSLWLMTDERIGEDLWAALGRLPRGAGIVFRHYRTEAGERRRLYERVRRIARARGLVLVLAGTVRQAIAWRADGVHGRANGPTGRRLLRTTPGHDAREAIAAARGGADVVFVSPVFATRSHPGGRVLGVKGFGRIAQSVRTSFPHKRESTSTSATAPRWIPSFAGMTAKVRIVALGGVDARRFRRLRPLGAYGWAAIDALTDQKRNVVPR